MTYSITPTYMNEEEGPWLLFFDMFVFCAINLPIYYFQNDQLTPFQSIFLIQDQVLFPGLLPVSFFLYSSISTGKCLLSLERDLHFYRPHFSHLMQLFFFSLLDIFSCQHKVNFTETERQGKSLFLKMKQSISCTDN